VTPRSPWSFLPWIAAVSGGLAIWLVSASPASLKTTLTWLAPRGLELSFLLLLLGAALSFAEIRDSLPSRRFLYPLSMGLLALVLVRTIPPETHRIYYDEDIYENVAQNILWMGRAQMCNEGTVEAGTFRCDSFEYNKEPNALPFFLSLVFRLSGVSETAAHAFNHIVLALGTVAVFWLAAMLFESTAAGFGAGLVFVLVPQNLLWSATVAAEPGASAFTALGLGAFVLFCKRTSWRTALFAGPALALASQFRPESGLSLAVAATFVLVRFPSLLRRRELWGGALLTLLLLAPQLAHTWAVRHEPWGAGEGAKFSRSIVFHNLRTNVGYYAGGTDFPRVFSLLALLGLLAPGRRREAFVVLCWFLLFFGIFLPFYAGSYRYGADVRFAFVSAAPVAVLAGAGLSFAVALIRRLRGRTDWLVAAPFLVVIYAFTSYLPLTRTVGRESWASRADHQAALRMVGELPEDSIVLTHNPGMIQVMGRSAAQTSLATYQPARVDDFFHRFPGGVYFHYNFWCNVEDPVQNEFCTNVLGTFKTQVIREESAGFYRYVLYRLLPRSQPPPAP
jgi:hypothetical protein